jgi:hypothetical protein
MKLLLGGAAVLLLTACGAMFGPGSAYPSPPTEALARWSDFPASQKPRPIILFWDFRPRAGYSSSDAKIAGFCNKFTVAAAFPTEVPSQGVATWADGTTASYGSISAADAFSALSRIPTGMASDQCAKVAALPITGVHLGTAQLATDRGGARMTAWLFTATGALGDMAYPALSPSAFWKEGISNSLSDGVASLGPDSHTLTFSFPGIPSKPGPCGADYTGSVAESASAVAVAVLAIPHASSSGPVACTLEAQERSVTITLTTPLGGRVVVNAAGDAVVVCPEAGPSSC